MSAVRETDGRLRNWLNGDQPSRERMCIAVLGCDRRYVDIRPRRPEGGPDGGRDIQALRDSQLCFGAVGFLNNVSDSRDDKRKIKKKFKLDVDAALAADPQVRAFVFFTNVDLTPGEIAELTDFAKGRGINAIDIYWRERIRDVLDCPEGLAARFQYLDVSLSDAEQKSFFNRFGKDLEGIVQGRLDNVERKIDALEFALWKTGTIRSMSLELRFRKLIEFEWKVSLHFRILLELQSVVSEGRSIFLGGRDDFDRVNDAWCFGTKVFFWRERAAESGPKWIRPSIRFGSGVMGQIQLSVQWIIASPVLAAEFRGLFLNLMATENIVGWIGSAELRIDSYVFLNRVINETDWTAVKGVRKWPEELSPEESAIGWRSLGGHGSPIWFGRTPLKRDGFD